MTTIVLTPTTRPGDYLSPIMRLLGGGLSHQRPGCWTLVIRNRQAGTALILQISPPRKAVQATIRRLTKGHVYLAQDILQPFQQIDLDNNLGTVRFSIGTRKFLEVSADAQLQGASVNIQQVIPALPPGRPAAARPLLLTGILTKSEYQMHNQQPSWIGGLSEALPGRDETAWHPLYATGNLATKASAIEIGSKVQIRGTYAQRRDQARQTDVRRALFIVHSVIQLVDA